MDDFASLTKKNKFIGNQPFTLTPSNFNKQTDFMITQKLDGSRVLVYINPEGVGYKITSKYIFTIIKLTKAANLLPNTILDCEFYKNKYYVFDILFYKNVDVREETLTSRIARYNDAIKIISSKKLIPKTYITLNCNTVGDFVASAEKNPELDGVILTPDGNYYAKVLKYKPLHLLSIDFKIQKTNDNTFLLLLQNNKIFSPRNPRYKDVGSVKVNKLDYKKYLDGSIVEFVFKNNNFVPIRARPDKNKSNSTFVVLDNWKAIINFKTLQQIVC